MLAPRSASAGDATGPVPAGLLVPPVDAVVERYFERPRTRFGPGHRGLDYAVASGTRIRAAGAGTVTWAGPVAGNLMVTIDHGDSLETTYSILSTLEVVRGEAVDEGRWLGTVRADHEGEVSGLHFGVKLNDDYVDPLDFLGPVDITGAIHLAPLVDEQVEDVPDELSMANAGAGVLTRPCRDPATLSSDPPPPNDNVAVAIAGLGSRTKGDPNAEIYERSKGPWTLGYPAARVYRFSYRGTNGKQLHDHYVPADSGSDINKSARRLGDLLAAIHSRHPDSNVDLFAHSQGGLVARAMLERLARSYDPRLPRVEHLVTYGTPHTGTPLAGVTADLDNETLTGSFLVDGMSDWARENAHIPDPRARAVRQMTPGSRFVSGLAREDVTFGTRVLSLAMPHDVVVPADRALYPGKDGRVLSPSGINGHDSVVSTDESRSLAYAFLRGAPDSCRGNWDEWGPVLGRGIGWAQSAIADLYAELETLGLARAFKVAKWAASRGWGVIRWAGAKALSGARWGGQKIVSGVRWAGGKVIDGARGTGGWVVDKVAAGGRLLRSGLARLWP
jgi:Peptidase family M23/Palmitoyl protein thioesterase